MHIEVLISVKVITYITRARLQFGIVYNDIIILYHYAIFHSFTRGVFFFRSLYAFTVLPYVLAILNCHCELNLVNVKALTFDLTLAILNFIFHGKCIAEQILLVAKTSESCYIYFSCIKWFSSAF